MHSPSVSSTIDIHISSSSQDLCCTGYPLPYNFRYVSSCRPCWIYLPWAYNVIKLNPYFIYFWTNNYSFGVVQNVIQSQMLPVENIENIFLNFNIEKEIRTMRTKYRKEFYKQYSKPFWGLCFPLLKWRIQIDNIGRTVQQIFRVKIFV